MTDEQIFNQAIRMDASERAGFLSEACKGDFKQRKRVEALIAAHDASDSLLDTEAMLEKEEITVECQAPRTLGDFEILRELGRGGMGVVYEARQKSLKRTVALKVLSSGLGLSSRAIMRFHREAEAAGKLHHTNIVPIYTTGEERSVHFYAMELINGPSLDRVIRELRNDESRTGAKGGAESGSDDVPAWLRETALYSESHRGAGGSDSKSDSASGSTISSGAGYFDTVATMIAEVADALDHAHEQGVIHRDVKPSNLLLSPDGRLSMNDFGLARMLEQPGMTMTGEFVGSPLYMSPEQITAGRAPLDHRTDIYSLGATLYELLTLQPPFPGESRDQVIAKILHKEPVSPRKLNRKVPVDLDTICVKAIEKDPDRRYQTAGRLAKDLRAYVNRHSISARRIGVIGRSIRWVRRNPSWASLILLVIVAVLGGTAKWRSDRIEALQDAKREYLMYWMSGNLEKAREQRELAKSQGASSDWLGLADAQIELYRGQPDRALDTLGRIPLVDHTKTRVRSIKAIARLFVGDERQHALDLLEIAGDLEDGDLDPKISEDHLYLAMAFQYADPDRAMKHLDEAQKEMDLGHLYHLVLCYVEKYAAVYELEPDSALQRADEAQRAASALSLNSDDSPFVVAAMIGAETMAGVVYRQQGDNDRSRIALTKSKEWVDSIESPKTHVTFAMDKYLLLDELAPMKANAYLSSLSDDLIDYYTRTYRMIDGIRTGDVDQVSRDINATGRNRDYKAPFLVLAKLSQNPTGQERTENKAEFRNHLDAVVKESSEDIYHAEFYWIVCRLLNMPDDERRCMEEIQKRAGKYEGVYVGETMAAFSGIAPDTPISEIERYVPTRRGLSYALIRLGIDALAQGEKEKAKQYINRCATEGVYHYYGVQFCRALVDKWKEDPEWPDWIDDDRPVD